MITLTRLNGKRFTLNAIYIEQVEAFPDTTITLTNGKKFVVRESVEDVMLLVETFYRNISVLGLRREAEGSDVERQ
ncbi:flagellar protein FlbD [Anoxybacillus flavithermus NBRC 109594]|uniref:Flagellar protein FlbD n=1 Tax=Anoxybacillus flavithermus NBRC 109594 TaxID=1315967 RepID=R4FGL2_9BACL|nr:flagellar FlbD family protein [Anoxybacillus flavithermus]GAC92065.1 flagellar protein FlbD [Anoxybacillus flavithermus NBRC 109594]